MGIAAYMEIRNGHFMDAVFNQFDWYLLIIGLFMLLGNMFNMPQMAVVGKYMAIAGAFLIVLGPFLNKTGVGRLSGIYDLYGITSYLGDILSYSRIFALCMSSAVIAQVFNELGSLFGGGIVGWVLFIIIALVGHTLNFLINALGSYVHSCRLQYVEFFGKFFEGGGEPFNPFERKTKYVQIMKEEN